MNKLIEKLKEVFPNLKTRSFKAGSYSFASTIVVLVILIFVNIFAESLPTNLTEYDITSAKLYSLSSQSKVVVNALDKDVTLYYVCQANEEDEVIEKLLEKYDGLSEHLSVVKKDPDIYPTFVSNYYSGSTENNAVIVECGDKYRYISYDDIYVADGTSYASAYQNTKYSFDGEGAITSAINYVVQDTLPKVYILSGHGEKELSESVLSSIQKENFEYETISLVNANEVPEDCECLIIYAPSSDISDDEKQIILDYLDNGGKLFASIGTSEDGSLANFNSIIENYNVEVNEGIVIDIDSGYYGFGVPYILMPDINEHDITSPLIEDNYYVLLPISSGFTTSSSSVTSLFDSSSLSYSKVDGYQITTYDKEDKDIDGSFSLGVAVEDGDAKIVWLGSNYFLDDEYVSYSSGANSDLLLNSLAWMSETKNSSISIRAKSLSYDYLTIPSSTQNYMKVVMLAVVPLIFIIAGLDSVIRRRNK